MGPVIAVACGAVLLLAFLMRSVRDGLDRLPEGESLDPQDVKEAGFDAEVAKILREEAGEPAVFEGARKRTGLAVLPDGANAEATRDRLEERLEGRAVVFRTEELPGAGEPSCIVALDSREPLDALAFMGTRNGEEIRRRLTAWRGAHPFSLLGCGNDWVCVRFEKPPQDAAFYTEVAAFCPAPSEHGGGLEEWSAKIRAGGPMHLWWDRPTERMER